MEDDMEFSSPDSANATLNFFGTSPLSAHSMFDESWPDLEFDANGLDASAGFFKDESESPPAEEQNKRQPIRHRKQSSTNSKPTSPKTATASGRSSKATKVSKSAASISRPGAGPSSLPIIPRKAEDWEPWKTILHQLYIGQNRILRDIINIMDTTYNLKATPKMYKNQFARWGFFKYSVKSRPRIKSDARAAKDPTTTSSTSEDPQVQEILDDDDDDDEVLDLPAHPSTYAADKVVVQLPMLHQDKSTRTMQSGMTAVQHFLRGYIDHSATHVQEEAVMLMHQPMYRYFKASMDLFDLNEHIQGGQVLRLAFLEIEPMMSNPTIKSFADLCLTVPHLLIESGRKDVLAAYLQFLARLATLKYGHHPMADIVDSFAELMNRPEDMFRYITTLTQVNAETLSSVEAMSEHNREWARNIFLGCQKTIEPAPVEARDHAPESSTSGTVSTGTVIVPRRDKKKKTHHMVRLEAQGAYWAQKLVLQSPEADELARQWLDKDFSPDFAPRAEAMYNEIKMRIQMGFIPPGMERLMESLCLGWLNDYYETMEDWPKVFEWGKRGLAMADNEQYVIWSIHLEGLMRKYGDAKEADELKRARLESGWLEGVRKKVEDFSL